MSRAHLRKYKNKHGKIKYTRVKGHNRKPNTIMDLEDNKEILEFIFEKGREIGRLENLLLIAEKLMPDFKKIVEMEKKK